MTDNQERENFFFCSYVHEGFISAVSLWNYLMKILVDLGIFNHVIFKVLGSNCYCKKCFFNKQTKNVWFKFKLRGFYNFTWRNIAIGQYHIYREQMKKNIVKCLQL